MPRWCFPPRTQPQPAQNIQQAIPQIPTQQLQPYQLHQAATANQAAHGANAPAGAAAENAEAIQPTTKATAMGPKPAASP